MRTELSVPFQTSKKISFAGQISLIALLAGLGAGCSNVLPMREPIFTGSTANQQQILSGQAAPAQQAAAYGTSGGGVQSSDLPPPAGSSTPAYAYNAQPAQATQPMPSYASPAPYTPPGQQAAAPAALGAPPTSLQQQAVRIDGGPARADGGTYVVQSGDTMWNIAQRHNVSVDALIAANGGSTVAPLGQKLVIPGAGAAQRNVQVASVDPRAVPAPPAPAPAPTPAVASASEILPQQSGQAPAAPAATPAQQPQQVALAPQTGASGAAAAAAPQQSAAQSAFRWPVRGRVISGFGKKPNGERNDGINLAVPEGTSVKAAEDGTVIYAGNELKSYGNLVLIRHSNGWVSAYAHNSELKVKRGDEVRRGQVVSMSGMSGGVTTPQVHFELRKDATPVDPLSHLVES